MGAKTTYSIEVRLILCPSCGAPIDVAPAGGHVRCNYCNAPYELRARGGLPAFLPRAQHHLSEAERERRLRSQEGQELLPRPHLVALLAGSAQIAPHRQNDALIAWQSARKRTAEESLEAAEDLFYLTNIFSNQYVDAKDWSRHRALTESALEVFFLPRHRAAMISTMCCGACRENDLVAAERWLALLDPASDDLLADSEYRIARGRVAALQQDWTGVIAAFGSRRGDVPIHDLVRSLAAVRRADAWEHLGRLDVAVEELAAEMALHPRSKRTVEAIVEVHPLCPQSLPGARAQEQARSEAAIVSLAVGSQAQSGGTVALSIGIALFVVAITALVYGASGGVGEAYILVVVIPSFVGLMALITGLVSNIRARNTRRRADRARYLATHGRHAFGTVLATTTVGSDITLRLRMEVEGVAPYEAAVSIVASTSPPVGDKIYVRVDPDDPLAVVADS